MLRLAALVVVSAFLTAPVSQAKEAKRPRRDKFHLFLLTGQSNMAGRGVVDENDRKPVARVLVLNKEGQWAPAADPLHWDKKTAGVGLGRTFGIELAKADPTITIGLVPCAAGGSPIATWEPGGYHDQTKSHPYDDTIARARRALADGTLRGILWHQGESDSNAEMAPQYEQKLHALITRLRKDLAAPAVPFIAGQMGRFEEKPWSDAKGQVDAAHRALPMKVAHTAFVEAEHLGHGGDALHFSAEAYRELGRRYASAYLGTRRK